MTGQREYHLKLAYLKPPEETDKGPMSANFEITLTGNDEATAVTDAIKSDSIPAYLIFTNENVEPVLWSSIQPPKEIKSDKHSIAVITETNTYQISLTGNLWDLFL